MKIAMSERPADGKSAAGTIEFFFDFISPYGWFAAEQIGVLAQGFERRVNWRPFLLSVTVAQIMKAAPPLELPLKGPYLLHDIRRSARFYGLAFSESARFGFNSVYAARAVTWVRSHAPEQAEPLTLALYKAHWSVGRDISETSTVLDIVEETGLDREGAAEALSNPEIKTAFRRDVASAIELGVFGSPTFLVDGEMFWGADRLPMLATWLEKGGW